MNWAMDARTRMLCMAIAVLVGSANWACGMEGAQGSPCSVGIAVQPSNPQVGDVVDLSLETSETVLSVRWEVTAPDGNPVEVETRNQGQVAEFTAERAGSYAVNAVIVNAEGAECSDQTQVQVTYPNAESQVYRLVLVPPAQANWPRQEHLLKVFERTPTDRADIQVAEGFQAQISVQGLGNPVAAYVRIGLPSGNLTWEGFASEDEPVRCNLPLEPAFDVLVVPTASLPGSLETSLSPSDLSALSLDVDPGTVVSGHVLDHEGMPVESADVLVTCDGLPSSVDRTGVTGEFGIRIRPGRSCALTVAWDEGRTKALARDLALSNISSEATMDITLDDVPIQDATVTVLDSSGIPVPDAVVTITGTDLPTVAHVQVASQEGESLDATMGASVVSVARTDEQGRVRMQRLVQGSYELVIEPPDRTRTTQVQLTWEDLTGQPAITLSSPVTVTGQVVVPGTGDTLEPVEGAEIQLQAQVGSGSTFHGVTDDQGRFEVSVPPGLEYDVWVSPSKDSGAAPWHLGMYAVAGDTVLSSGAQDRIVLPRGLTVSGKLLGIGTGGAGIQVYVPGDEQPLIVDQADVDGGFTLVLPDPGDVAERLQGGN